ncbi:uncharacterized protein Triagg1_8182 [Trichoderma aggressivum f. europaeum]|uniref:Uncharacterized protein n=1 Tax=Trichoderma aggressivum f. europaeum TaxID=173218 RepID=A0AAE1LWA7_9HYPO|nr:hypothetical protein Triagg1_8182 [Trichoderma aggressivum f. europaeum]
MGSCFSAPEPSPRRRRRHTRSRARHREDAEHKRRSHKTKKKRSSHHKKKKRGHHRSSRRSSRQYTETEADSAWTADDDNHYQVALWIGESSRAPGGTNSPQEGGSGAREAAEDGDVSSPGEEDGGETPTPEGSKKPKKN